MLYYCLLNSEGLKENKKKKAASRVEIYINKSGCFTSRNVHLSRDNNNNNI
jgi:hypothetical protein